MTWEWGTETKLKMTGPRIGVRICWIESDCIRDSYTLDRDEDVDITNRREY